MALVCKSSNLSAPQARLLSLSRELRDMIFDIVSAAEQEQHLEILDVEDNRTVFCMPLQKICPSPLLRVCRQIRREYLDSYFRGTCFRVYTHVLAGLSSGNHCNQCHKCNETGEIERWLDAPVERVQFRRLQFTFMDNSGTARGANVDVTYYPGEKEFSVKYRVHDGWPLQYDGHILPLTHVGAENLLGAVPAICLSLREGEGLSWQKIKELRKALNNWHHVHRADRTRDYPTTWNVTVKVHNTPLAT